MTVPSPVPTSIGQNRLVSLDVIRGVAVMGILVANLPAFALPAAAYFSPLAAGGTAPADIALWLLNFVTVEGRMRGLFSVLFGASMLLVMGRAADAGDDPPAVHLSRMASLFAIGLLHLYLIWWGDILAHYALCGAIALPFTRLRTRGLLLVGGALVAVAWAIDASVLTWLSHSDGAMRQGFAAVFGVPPAADIAREIAAHRGGLIRGIAWRWNTATGPLEALWVTGPQTIGAMLLGMAGLRSGFLTGAWSRARYRRWAIIGIGVSLPGHLALGLATIAHGFTLEWVYGASMVWSLPLRVAGIAGYAALIMLAIRPDGAWTQRVAAVGRCAFTNYLGTSIAMTFVFEWGLAQFGQWSRASLYLLAIPAWAIMLGWSAPWLRRHPYGPLEWLWRSLSRAEWQRWRRDQ
jgi:uncharacterized protein